ncbi:MAG TPA: pyruvate ferredoxin oxidoreductase [Armatimonadota bacterium]|nr:pyruvate ferredoxin oxidoreductase [Armatimonadota bacterium]
MTTTKERIALTGNEAAAMAMKQINPDVCAAYPITPATEIMQIFASYVADGLVDTELVTVESEHSAMSATIGAAAAGARAMTATSSQGLALMWEMLYIAAGLRLPIVMPMVNRALSAPINIHCDHSDSMGARDSGWIQIFSENAQETYDNTIQAVRIAEHPDLLLPAMVTLDGFIISHAMEPVDVYETEQVWKFIGPYKPRYSLLDVDHPITVGAIDLTDYYFEHKRSEVEPMLYAHRVIEEVGVDFERRFGRRYGLFEEYKMEDAEVAAVVLGSTAGTAKVVVDELREKGVKAGMVKIRVFRPFPYKQIADALSKVAVVAVLDRSEGMAGFGGPVFGEVRSALYDLEKRPVVIDYVYGLGGRDITLGHISSVYDEALAISRDGKRPSSLVSYLGVRE